ncbi:MAG: hydroxyisourate hydrolase [Lacipirellulaceae bacterium]
MSPITTHILDTALGKPAAGISVILYSGETEIGRGETNSDGRVTDLLPEGDMNPGTYRIRFEVAEYLAKSSTAAFYPFVDITFEVTEGEAHYHVPLLLSPFGYSTYRGS